MKIGYLQYEVAFGDFEANAAKIRDLVGRAESADLLVLPELCFSGYDFLDSAEVARHAEPVGDGPAAALLRELATTHSCTLVAGYAEQTPDGCYNACLCVQPDGTQHNYRKIHLFNREQSLFLPGDAPPPVVNLPKARIGLMICFDWFFPETARSLALRGAEILAHPSNLVLPWCQRAMFARCVENRVFAITANRTGTEDRAGRSLTFTGGSQVLSPRGEVLAQAETTGDAIAVVEIDPALARDKRVAELNDLFGDRRPDLYPGL